MTNNHLLFRALDVIDKHERFTESTTREYNEALIELGWVENGWNTLLTKEGREMLKILRSIFKEW